MQEQYLGFIFEWLYYILKEENKIQNQEHPKRQVLSIKNSENLNNVMLKKLKIALSLTSDDMLVYFKSNRSNCNKRRIKCFSLEKKVISIIKSVVINTLGNS